MKVLKTGENGRIGIGLTKYSVKSRNGDMPGWSGQSIGYHGDDGGIFHNAGNAVTSAETFTTGDTVGCLITRTRIAEKNIQMCSFTKNGKRLQPIRYLEEGEFFPTIGMGSNGALVEANLGEKEFLFDVQGIIISITHNIITYNDLSVTSISFQFIVPLTYAV